MYVSQLKLWNFRKFWTRGSTSTILDSTPADLVINFNKWLNLLIWENDSWKTAIIDALKLILKTHTSERIKIDKEDFTEGTNNLRIECVIKSRFNTDEETILRARRFTERMSFDAGNSPFLRLILNVSKTNDKINPYELKAWSDFFWYQLSAEAKERLKCTYLKPLRDAETELMPKKWSRLAQILDWHNLFENKEDHQFIQRFKEINEYLKGYFSSWNTGETINKHINDYLSAFYWDVINAPFSVNDPNLKSILELLRLSYEDIKKWLGNQNLLFIATELLHLRRDDNESLKLWLIEEVEAHLHPQSQMRVIEKLQKDSNSENNWVQLISSTHSPNLWSKTKLENLILCTKNGVFNMDKGNTKLEEGDYPFLERFLDVTKANLFFAKWVLLVEWWGEELLLPTIAKKMWYDLTSKWVSVINIGNTSHLRYARIFWRIDWSNIGIPIAVVTDLDVKPADLEAKWEIKRWEKQLKFSDISDDVKIFISPVWTLEYCIAKSIKLRPILLKAICLAQIDEHNWWWTKVDDIIQFVSEHDFSTDNSEPNDIYLQISEWKKADWSTTLFDWLLYVDKISKSILAQHLAKLLEEQESLFFEELKDEIIWDENHWIKYLFDAIKYACWDWD